MSFEENSTKSEVIAKYKIHETDTRSPEVQIAILTKEFNILSKHFASHPQDKLSKRGLAKKVSQRKRLLNYLKNEDVSRYRLALEKFNLRK